LASRAKFAALSGGHCVPVFRARRWNREFYLLFAHCQGFIRLKIPFKSRDAKLKIFHREIKEKRNPQYKSAKKNKSVLLTDISHNYFENWYLPKNGLKSIGFDSFEN
jgi:hypothetical protein